MNRPVEIREADDWIAVYQCGQKVWEGHSCSIRQGLEALHIPFEFVDVLELCDGDGNFLDSGEFAFPDRINEMTPSARIPDDEFWAEYRRRVHAGELEGIV